MRTAPRTPPNTAPKTIAGLAALAALALLGSGCGSTDSGPDTGAAADESETTAVVSPSSTSAAPSQTEPAAPSPANDSSDNSGGSGSSGGGGDGGQGDWSAVLDEASSSPVPDMVQLGVGDCTMFDPVALGEAVGEDIGGVEDDTLSDPSPKFPFRSCKVSVGDHVTGLGYQYTFTPSDARTSNQWGTGFPVATPSDLPAPLLSWYYADDGDPAYVFGTSVVVGPGLFLSFDCPYNDYTPDQCRAFAAEGVRRLGELYNAEAGGD